ncbi:hypothetical protein OHS70_38050 [Streptomyces sp. NBC_00390]|uniref:hypothetical protein n=1 Tax=Streptomyces sp. NBC_00390 TaxID=2975736 RepID=UPI002E24E511
MDLRLETEDLEGTEKFARKALEAGDTLDLVVVADAYAEKGNHDKAETLIMEAAAAGGAGAFLTLAEYRLDAGDAAGAQEWAVEAGSRGSTGALLLLAGLRAEAGDIDEAEGFVRQAANGGAFGDSAYSDIGYGQWLPDQVATWWPYGLDADGAPSGPWRLSD